MRFPRGISILAFFFATLIVILSSASECEALTLTITEKHGSVTATPDKADYDIGEVVELKPKPDTGYYFSGWAGDAQGKRLVLNLTMDSNKAVTANFDTWKPPIGIPMPEFGIFETYRMYAEPANRNPALTYTQNAEGGFYTHYVDNTHPNATDSSNPYGTASVPRDTIPRNLDAGSVVDVHGGPYTYVNAGNKNIIEPDGTASLPIFVRGINRPEFRRAFNIAGQYMIFENFYLYNAGISIRIPGGTSETFHHISVRNVESEGDGTTTGGAGLGTASSAEHIVFYNNDIHHGGDYAYEGENDVHGTNVGPGGHNIWFVDNHIHHMGGDGFQAGHSAPEGSISYIYIGRNVMHSDGENAVDLKNVADVIVSENTMYNYPGDSGSSGHLITVSHYGGTAPGPQRVWFLFNEMYNARAANQVGGSARDDVYFIGNVIYDIRNEAFITWSSRDVYFVNNTLYNYGKGIDSTGSSSYAATILNNIFGSLNSPSGSHVTLAYSDYRDNAIVSNNIFQDTMNVNTSSSNYIEANPQFVDPANNNFHLGSTSPAQDAGIESDVYQTFYDLYGIDIRKDFDGNERPQGDGWDIGAYEYVDVSTPSLPSGDVTGDGVVNIQDILGCVGVILGSETDTGRIARSDVNGDSAVNIVDLLAIVQIILAYSATQT